MKLFLLGFGLVSAKTECNGSKYSPLGCFTDDPPFSVPGYRPGTLSSKTAQKRRPEASSTTKF